MRKLTLICGLIVLSGCAANMNVVHPLKLSEPIQSPVVPVLPDNISTFTLENGLQVLAIRNTAAPMVGLNLIIRVGSAYENFATSGMSHMLEHLLFNGTERRSQEELYEETDYLGAYSNAHTDRYYTNFMFLLPSELMEEGMDIQADMIFNSTLPPVKFEKERGIVTEEIRKDRDSASNARGGFFQRMNHGSDGPGLPVIGTLSTIEHLARDEVYEFYRKHYVPNNMVLAIIGNFDGAQLREQIEKFYGKPAPQPVPPLPETDFELVNGKFNQARGQTDRIAGQIVFDAPVYGAQEQTSYEVMASVLGEYYAQQLPEKDISFGYSADPNAGRLIMGFAPGSDSDVQALLDQLVTMLGSAEADLKNLLTQDKLSRIVKERRVDSFALLDQPHYYGIMNAQDLALGGPGYVLQKIDHLAALDPAQILKDVQYFTRATHQFNLYYPATVTDETEDADAVASARTILPSGAILVSASGGGSAMFGMHILIKNRHILEDSLEGAAEILHGLLTSGTANMTAAEIQAQLSRLGATMKTQDMGFIPYDNYYNSPDFGYIRFECLVEDAPAGIRLLIDLLDNTIITPEKVESALGKARRRVSMQSRAAISTASREYTKLLLGADHPSNRSVSGSTESLTKINTANLTNLQSQYFDPSNYIISISSGIPHTDLVALFNQAWTVPGTPAERVTASIPAPSGRQEKHLDLGKEQAQIRIGYTYPVEADDLPAIELMGRILSYRMMFDLRETRGLAYTLSIRPGSDGDIGWFTASMGTAPKNIDQAVRGIESYFDPARLNDLDRREVEKTVNAWKGRYSMRNLTRIGQAFYMGYYEYYSGDYRYAMDRRTALDGISVEAVQDVARRYLKLPENRTVVIVK